MLMLNEGFGVELIERIAMAGFTAQWGDVKVYFPTWREIALSERRERYAARLKAACRRRSLHNLDGMEMVVHPNGDVQIESIF